MPCRHPDIRKFDGIRCCLACGEAVFEDSPPATTDKKPGSPYQYRRLNYALGQEIRIIELLPGIDSDNVRCNLIHVNLDDDPEYEAVSYTWATEAGDAALSQIIHTQGDTIISVTVNCVSALRQLRKTSSSQRLWIDAICIDQSTASERNHQVTLMGQIYTKASSVRICIEDVELRRFVTPIPVDYGPLFRWLKDLGRKGHEPLFPSLSYLISFGYFTRVWVIQELALAKEAYLHVNSAVLLLSVPVLRFIRERHHTRAVLSWDTSSRDKADILTCLRAGMGGECTDPKDRIFAVLGLMEPVAQKLIPIDYSLTIEEIYTHVIIAITMIHKKMDILRYTGWGNRLDLEVFRRFLQDCKSGSISRRNQSFQFAMERRVTDLKKVSLFKEAMSLRDLLEFTTILRECRYKIGTPIDAQVVWNSTHAFGTYYSVGYSHVRVEPGDCISAVDGVQTPLILRRYVGSDSTYKVIGECYLWAALELDYWNPGTRKGRWSSRPYDLGEQTRLIEIR